MIYIFAALLLVGSVFGQVYDEANYPNPQQSDNYLICGRTSRSYICDPDNVLRPDDAAQLDAELYRIVKDTQCPCSAYTCSRSPQGTQGYRVGIAIVKRLSAEDRPDARDEHHHADLRREETRRRMEKTLDDAKRVAFRLHKNWALGQCKEDVLILYSQYDDVIYTVTGSVARMKLDDNKVIDIALEARRENIENFAFRGLMRIVESYRYVFMNQYAASPRTGQSKGRNHGISMNQSNHCLQFLVFVLAIVSLLLWH